MRRPIVPRRHTPEPRRLAAAYPSCVYPGDQLSWNLEPREFSFRCNSYPNWNQSGRNELPESLQIGRVRTEPELEHKRSESQQSDSKEESAESEGGVRLPTKGDEDTSCGEILGGSTLVELDEKFPLELYSSSQTLCGESSDTEPESSTDCWFGQDVPNQSIGESSPKTTPEHSFLGAPLSGTAEDKIEQLAQARKELQREENDILGRFQTAVVGVYQHKHTRLEQLRKEVIDEHAAARGERDEMDVYELAS